MIFVADPELQKAAMKALDFRANRKNNTDAALRIVRFIDCRGENGCWNWLGQSRSHGYGYFWADGKWQKACRWLYSQVIGPVPEGLHLDHLCRNRLCVNPFHLEPVSPGENTRRGALFDVLRIRWAAITHCPKGHAYSGDNLHMYGNKRRCRACDRLRHAKI